MAKKKQELTVKELREYLAQFPDDMKVLETRCSDLGPMDLDSWGPIEGVEQVSGPHGWVQHLWEGDYRINGQDVSRVKQYLHYSGN